MKEHHSLAAIELVENRREGWVAGPFVEVIGPQGDAICLEHVQRVFDFPQASFGIGKWQRC